MDPAHLDDLERRADSELDEQDYRARRSLHLQPGQLELIDELLQDHCRFHEWIITSIHATREERHAAHREYGRTRELQQLVHQARSTHD